MSDEIEEKEENEDLYEHHRFTADKGQGQIRLDKFLMARIENATRTRIQNSVKAGNVLVNGEVVKSNYKVKPLDEVSVVMAHPPRDKTIYPEEIPLNISKKDN